MEMNKDTCKIVADLEYLIGSECHNPNAYDGWNEVEGCSFRYPVMLRNKEGEFVKIRSNLNNTVLLKPEDITPESVRYMKYKLGSNELFIGKGIVNILEYLEKRYQLDFNALEQNLRKKANS